MLLKLGNNFTRHHLITHTNITFFPAKNFAQALFSIRLFKNEETGPSCLLQWFLGLLLGTGKIRKPELSIQKKVWGCYHTLIK